MLYRASFLVAAVTADYGKTKLQREAHPHKQASHHNSHDIRPDHEHGQQPRDMFDRLTGGKQDRHQQHGHKHAEEHLHDQRHEHHHEHGEEESFNAVKQHHHAAGGDHREGVFEELPTPPGVVRVEMQRQHNLKPFSMTSLMYRVARQENHPSARDITPMFKMVRHGGLYDDEGDKEDDEEHDGAIGSDGIHPDDHRAPSKPPIEISLQSVFDMSYNICLMLSDDLQNTKEMCQVVVDTGSSALWRFDPKNIHCCDNMAQCNVNCIPEQADERSNKRGCPYIMGCSNSKQCVFPEGSFPTASSSRLQQQQQQAKNGHFSSSMMEGHATWNETDKKGFVRAGLGDVDHCDGTKSTYCYGSGFMTGCTGKRFVGLKGFPMSDYSQIDFTTAQKISRAEDFCDTTGIIGISPSSSFIGGWVSNGALAEPAITVELSVHPPVVTFGAVMDSFDLKHQERSQAGYAPWFCHRTDDRFDDWWTNHARIELRSGVKNPTTVNSVYEAYVVLDTGSSVMVASHRVHEFAARRTRELLLKADPTLGGGGVLESFLGLGKVEDLHATAIQCDHFRAALDLIDPDLPIFSINMNNYGHETSTSYHTTIRHLIQELPAGVSRTLDNFQRSVMSRRNLKSYKWMEDSDQPHCIFGLQAFPPGLKAMEKDGEFMILGDSWHKSKSIAYKYAFDGHPQVTCVSAKQRQVAEQGHWNGAANLGGVFLAGLLAVVTAVSTAL